VYHRLQRASSASRTEAVEKDTDKVGVADVGFLVALIKDIGSVRKIRATGLFYATSIDPDVLLAFRSHKPIATRNLQIPCLAF